MSERPVVDAEQRQDALDARRSFIVQAPAGSGKTALLVQRYLLLLASVNAPEEILAITFTRKAAAEMRARILEALHAARRQVAPEREHERRLWALAGRALARDREAGWNLLDNPARLRIQTIDSLCAALTRQMPVTARFGAQPQIIEDASPLYHEAARRTLALLEQDGDWSAHIEALLLHLDNDLPRVQQMIGQMLSRRDQWLRHLSGSRGDPQVRAQLEAVLAQVVGAALTDVTAALPPRLLAEWWGLTCFAVAEIARAGGKTPASEFAADRAPPQAAAETLALWLRMVEVVLTKDDAWRQSVTKREGFPVGEKGDSAAYREELKAIKARHGELVAALAAQPGLCERLAALRRLPTPAYRDEQWNVLAALFELLPLAVAQLYTVFRERRAVDFSQISLAAVQALGAPDDPTDLALALDYRIQHVLVDEFQDTSFSQYQLLERLTAGWQSDDGRTLFLVGDPMQSIYRFREADVGLFLWARRHGVGSVQLVPLTLRVNFRSQAGIVDWVNGAFRTILPAAEDVTTGAVSFSASVAFRDPEPGSAVYIHPQIDAEPNPEREAQQVVAIVQQAQQQRPSATIAILVKAKRHLAAIAPALKRAGLRFQALDIENLGSRPVVQDLLGLTRALLHPGDRIAWLAVLRAPWCGLSLADLQLLAGLDREAPLWDRIRDEACCAALSIDARQRLARVRAVLASALQRRWDTDLRRCVEGAWLGLGGPACAGDPTDRDDAQSFFDLLDQLTDAREDINASALELELAQLFAAPDRGAAGGLQLMTIHKAKGLEFDIVIVPGLGYGSPAEDRPLLRWLERPSERESGELLLAPIAPRGGARDAIYDYVCSVEQQKSRWETGRLLYVAATRAKCQLHWLGHVKPGGADGSLQPRSNTLLEQLWPVLRETYRAAAEQAPAPAAEAGVPDARQGRTLKRLPADFSVPMPPAAVPVITPDVMLAGRARSDMPIEFLWASPSARHVGTVVHRLLRHIALAGPIVCNDAWLQTQRGAVRDALQMLGVPAGELGWTGTRVLEAVGSMLRDERGRWILDPGKADSRCEFAVSGVHEGQVVNAVIDRTFVDEHGTRWIIDYKTGSHAGGDLEGFLNEEVARYRDQLGRYAALLRAMDDRPVRVGLYFPLLTAWREWLPETQP